MTLADLFNVAAKDDHIRVALWHGAGDSFSAGNDVEDFLKNPTGPGESPQARLANALIDLDKPLIAAVQCAAIGGAARYYPEPPALATGAARSTFCNLHDIDSEGREYD